MRKAEAQLNVRGLRDRAVSAGRRATMQAANPPLENIQSANWWSNRDHNRTQRQILPRALFPQGPPTFAWKHRSKCYLNVTSELHSGSRHTLSPRATA